MTEPRSEAGPSAGPARRAEECLHSRLAADPATGAWSWVFANPSWPGPEGWYLLGAVCADCGQDIVRAVFYDEVRGFNGDGVPIGTITRGGPWSTTDGRSVGARHG